MMNWFFRLLGLHDKKQEQRTQEVAEYVHGKKNEYTSDMMKIQKQARATHSKVYEALQASVELSKTVDSITYKIAVATGGKRRGL